MKLLLDEMHDPAVTAALRVSGHDVVAVTERAGLPGTSDPDLLLLAAAEARALVTENVKDFAPLHARFLADGRTHRGLILTSPRRFPRAARDHVATLTRALAAFLDENAPELRDVESFVWWLDAPRRSDR